MSHPGAARGADDAGLAAELGVLDPGLGRGDGKGHGADVAADRVEEARTRGDHAAAEEDDVGVDRVHQGDGADGQVAGRLAHQAAGQRVAGVGRLGDGLAGQTVLGQCLAGAAPIVSCASASWARLTSEVAEA